MFDSKKLLGGLLGDAMGKGSIGSGFGSKAAIGMGVLGMVWAAAEHFKEHGSLGDSARADTRNAPQQQAAQPPPPPGKQAAASPPPPPPAAPPQPNAPAGDEAAVLLIRAMIAAAHADGELDAQERGRILDRLQALDLSDEEQTFLQRELQTPRSAEDIAAAAGPGLAPEVYAASLLAVEVDTPEEAAYMQRLQGLLGLDDRTAQDVKRQIGAA